MSDVKLGFIGAGNMAEALIRGIIAKGVYQPHEIGVADVSSERTGFLAREFGVQVFVTNVELIQGSNSILFAVKPQNMAAVMAEISSVSSSEQLFLSICAGTRSATIEAGISTSKNASPRVVRVMPNTPALVGLGVSGISAGAHATDADIDTAEKIFRAVGVTTRIDESLMDAVTALTGSGPAYIFFVIESLIEAGIRVGFNEPQAREMVLQMVLGSATLARNSDKSPRELRRAVTSPKGTTEAGVAVLEQQGVMDSVIACVIAAEARGRELGKAQTSSAPK